MSREQQNRYQRNLTLIQIFCGVGYTMSGFLLALGTALLVTGRAYLDETLLEQQKPDSPLIAAGFNLISDGIFDIIIGAIGVLITMTIGSILTNREFRRANN